MCTKIAVFFPPVSVLSNLNIIKEEILKNEKNLLFFLNGKNFEDV